MPRPRMQLLGQRFGRLLVIADGGSDEKGAYWLCMCDCGHTKRVRSSHLSSGAIVSCGCYHAERQKEPRSHGKRHSRIWAIWQNMRQRCSNPKASGYKDYGGRGISVCPEWESFENFYADMGDVPDKHSLDRIDVDGDYCKDNCRWAKAKTQARNTRTNRILEHSGKKQTLVEWAEELRIDYYTLHSRLKRGWSIDRALTIQGDKHEQAQDV